MFSNCNVETLILSSGAVLVLVIHAVCWNLRRSRCTELSACGVNCKRNVMSLEELQSDLMPSNV